MKTSFSIKKMFIIILIVCISLMILLTLSGALFGYLAANGETPMYSTSALILIQSGDSGSSSVINDDKTYTDDISSSEKLVNTCATLFMKDPDMKSLISGASVSIEPVEGSFFLRITSTSADPHTAANIANLVAKTAPVVFKKYFDAGRVDTVDEAFVPSSPSSPSYGDYVRNGALIGLGIADGIAIVLAAAGVIIYFVKRTKKS